MKTNYENAGMLDMIFEHRNKSYGAYALRSDYNRRIAKALLITFSSIFLLAFGKFLSDKMKHHHRNAIEHLVVVEPIDEIHLPEEKVEIEKPKLPPVEQPQGIQTLRNTEMNVTPDNQVSDSIPTVEQMRDIDPGITTNLNGNTIGVTDGTGDNLIATQVEEPEPPAFVLVPEVMPVFPGGERKLMEFLQRNTNYPDYERDAQIEGRTFIRFIVNEDGTIVNPEVLKSTTKGFSKEAVRVVSMLPKFTPGMQHGKAVRVPFVLPFSFALND